MPPSAAVAPSPTTRWAAGPFRLVHRHVVHQLMVARRHLHGLLRPERRRGRAGPLCAGLLAAGRDRHVSDGGTGLVWGKRFDLRTQCDMLGMRFDSKAVRVIASLIGIICLFPWLVLGIQAMAVLFHFASFGTWSVGASLVAGVALIGVRQIWTVQMGMRGLVITDLVRASWPMAAARCCAWACSGSAARRPTRIWRRCRPSCCACRGRAASTASGTCPA